MANTLLVLALILKEMNNSKRFLRSLKMANNTPNHPNILYLTIEKTLKVTNMLEDVSSNSP